MLKNAATSEFSLPLQHLKPFTFSQTIFGSFPFVPPPQYVMLPPVTEHVSLHSKSLCKNIARASGVANNMHPLSWGGTNGKDPKFHKTLK